MTNSSHSGHSHSTVNLNPRFVNPFPKRTPIRLPAVEWSLYDLYTKMELPLVPLIDQMMANGMGIDVEYMKELSIELRQKQEEHTREAANLLGISEVGLNLASPPQVGAILFGQLRLRPISFSKLTKEPSTDETTIGKLQEQLGVDPTAMDKVYEKDGTPKYEDLTDKTRASWFMFHLLQFRMFDKLKDSYVDKMLKLVDAGNRIYTTLDQTSVVSGRLSSKDPFNFMAIPKDGYWAKRVRKGFKPRPGYTHVALDFSQVEMRVTAHASHDPNMMVAFITDQDIHSMTAAMMFSIPINEVDKDLHRYPAKRVGFGTQFGLTEQGLLPHLPPINRNLQYAKEFIERYFKVYALVKDLIDEVQASTRRYGYARDQWGRIRFMPEINSAIERIQAEGARGAFSHFIQGTAQGIIKIPMGDTLGLIDHYKFDCIPLIQIHDEMDWEVRDDQVQDAAECFGEVYANAVKLDVPIKVEVDAGPTWGDLKNILAVTSR